MSTSLLRQATVRFAVGLQPLLPTTTGMERFVDSADVSLVKPVHGHAESVRQDWPSDYLPTLPLALNRQTRRALGIATVGEVLGLAHGNPAIAQELIGSTLQQMEAQRQQRMGWQVISSSINNSQKH